LFLAASLATAVQAQVAPNRGPTQPVPSTPTVKLTMEDQHVLKENLLKTPKSGATSGAASESSTDQAELERGKQVPASIQLRHFPDEIARKIPQIKSHEYFVADDTIVIVESQKRTIVEVVK
jgi:hypothetical protein